MVKTNFLELGTFYDATYTNQQMLDKLRELLDAIRFELEERNSPFLKDHEILPYIIEKAEETGFSKTREFSRLKTNFEDMGFFIGSLIKGFRGEEACRKALRLISIDENVRVMYNVQLQFGDMKAEYDAIVITPYGMFVVEAKNWKATNVTLTSQGILKTNENNPICYDIEGRFCEKEALLKRCLEDLAPSRYKSILMLTNINTELVDEYGKVPVVIGGRLSKFIKEYDDGKVVLSAKQIGNIHKSLVIQHREQKGYCPVRCDEIINDFLMFLKTWDGEQESCDEKDDSRTAEIVKEIIADNDEKASKQKNSSPWKKLLRRAVEISPTLVPLILATYVACKKSNGRC